MDILNVYGTIIFSAAVGTIKDLLIAAVKSGADLRGANLRSADLYGANLRGANLRSADLYGANLRGADLYGANLRGADLYCADLYCADLYGANLRGADLRGANLRSADLYGANLRGANLRSADLYCADLYCADLRGANLRGANLRGANLYGANLRGADLYGADLYGANNIPDLAAAENNILPEGDLIGWKKCQNGVLIKLLIPKNSPRSNATGRKCRTQFVKVLEVIGAKEGISIHDSDTKYTKGKKVSCDKWEENRWIECAGGIHFYLSRIEAENN